MGNRNVHFEMIFFPMFAVYQYVNINYFQN